MLVNTSHGIDGMDARSHIRSKASLALPGRAVRELAPLLAATLLSIEVLTSGLLLSRRLWGGWDATGSNSWLIAWSLTAAAIAVAVRLLARVALPADSRGAAAIVRYVPLAAQGATAAALTMAHTPPAVVALVWAVAAAEEIVSLGWIRPAAPRGPTRRDRARHGPPASPLPRAPIDRRRSSTPRAPRPLASSAQCALRQTTARARVVDGPDDWEASLETRLSPEQTVAHLHVAFCPPFDAVPRIEFRQTSGPAARVKLGQALPYGARFDVKLDAPAPAAECVQIEVRATCGDRAADAAESGQAAGATGSSPLVT